MTSHKLYRFLLGGYDLEMITIRKILEEKRYAFYDKHLKWGARLSSYKEFFNNTEHFVGIELIEDAEKPETYTCIDHHSEKESNEASIQQVANLLHIGLTRYQTLVAANDMGYIPAMIAEGATEDEIMDIRQKDREAQGVTEKDELLGEKSIRHNLTVDKGITIVKSFTPKFSTITDKLYPFERLLIYTDKELTYYGKGVLFLAMAYKNLVENRKAFFGGGENGFFGITPEGINDLKDSKTAVKQIVKIITNG